MKVHYDEVLPSYNGLSDNWLWFLPLAVQYDLAAGRVRAENKELPNYGQ